MTVVGKKRIEKFCKHHADALKDAQSWVAEAEDAVWQNPRDIQAAFPSASFVGNHVIFNLRHNRFRLDVKVNYSSGLVTILRIGTHAEYDRWSFSD